MNSCPLCHRTYEDEAMKFCLEDGSALQQATILTDPNATLVLPTPGPGPVAHTVATPHRTTSPAQPLPTQVDHFPVVPNLSAERPPRSPLPWILGIVVVLGIFGIVIALILARALTSRSGGTEQAGMATSSPAPSESRPAASPARADISTADLPPQVKPGSSPSRTQPTKSVVEVIPSTSPPPKATPTPKATPEKETEAGKKPKLTIAGGAMNGKAVHLVQPVYPPIARQAHASGTVTVQVLIDESGNVIGAHAVSGHQLLQASAVAAARASKFSPTMLSGQAVKVTGVIHYNFVSQ